MTNHKQYMREYMKNYYARKKQDPEYRERMRQYSKDYSARKKLQKQNAPQVVAEQRTFLQQNVLPYTNPEILAKAKEVDRQEKLELRKAKKRAYAKKYYYAKKQTQDFRKDLGHSIDGQIIYELHDKEETYRIKVGKRAIYFETSDGLISVDPILAKVILKAIKIQKSMKEIL
jgi:hypothetical protein